MTAATALIVFAKAPVAGQAKTRLMPALGAAGAAALAERLLNHAVAQAAAAGFAALELCTSPDVNPDTEPDATHPAFQRLAYEHGLALTSQGAGDLGQRMNRALNRALGQRPRALLMGTDAPALSSHMLIQAAAALARHDAVFVPALDGGYALVGLRRPAPFLFEGMGWSHDQVMADTRSRAQAAGLRWAELPPVADIDLPADLARLPADWLPSTHLARATP